MTARRTGLATLLRVRRIQEERARAEVGRAAEGQRGARDILEAALAGYAALGGTPTQQTRQDFVAERNHLQALAGSVQVARARALDVDLEMARARARWSDAAMRVSAVERLEEREQAARRQARLDADQRAAEESGPGAAGRPTTGGTR